MKNQGENKQSKNNAHETDDKNKKAPQTHAKAIDADPHNKKTSSELKKDSKKHS